ncbi:MAG: superoxide dismutase [Ni] [Thermodesulfobacteriota bacterium]
MKRAAKITAGVVLIVLAAISLSYAHCEIPCGIYDDQARIELMREHIDTIERSMNQIRSLNKDLEKESDVEHQNQLVRWINNKEDHADKLQHIVSQYFMTQRISTDDDKYSDKISCLHKILVDAMKSKQTVDEKYVKSLRDLVDHFENLYMD